MSVKQLFDLSGRKAVITGGSRGLGLQIAHALGEMGAELVLSARKAHELDRAVAELAAAGVRAHPLAVDLADAGAATGFVDAALARLGDVDILVNNAGTTWGAPAENHPLEAWTKVLALNLTAAFLLSREFGRRSMIPRRRGRILNIASIAGLGGNPPDVMRTIGYNTSKGGLVNFTRALAAEWGEHDITVNAIAPGFFPTKIAQATMDAHGDEMLAMTPLRRFGGDEDLKGAALLLCSDAGRHITGQVIAVDGGFSAI